MISNFEREFRQLHLWQYIDRNLTLNETISQADIISHAENNDFGSRKSVLEMLNCFVEQKLINEIELPPEGPGRPKKAYIRPEAKEETAFINLGNLPEIFKDYIDQQAKQQKIGKGEIIMQILTWAYLQYQQGFEEIVMVPVEFLPAFFKPDKNPITRLTRIKITH